VVFQGNQSKGSKEGKHFPDKCARKRSPVHPRGMSHLGAGRGFSIFNIVLLSIFVFWWIEFSEWGAQHMWSQAGGQKTRCILIPDAFSSFAFPSDFEEKSTRTICLFLTRFSSFSLQVKYDQNPGAGK